MPDARVSTPYQYILRDLVQLQRHLEAQGGLAARRHWLLHGDGDALGNPNASGSWTFTVNVTDGLLGNAEKSFTLTVY